MVFRIRTIRFCGWIDLVRYANLRWRQKPAGDWVWRKAYAGVYRQLFLGRGIDCWQALQESSCTCSFYDWREREVLEKWRKTSRRSLAARSPGRIYFQTIKYPSTKAAADVLLLPYGRSVSGSSGGDIAVFSATC